MHSTQSIQQTHLCTVGGKAPRHSRQSANIHLAIFLFILFSLLVIERESQLLHLTEVVLYVHVNRLPIC